MRGDRITQVGIAVLCISLATAAAAIVSFLMM